MIVYIQLVNGTELIGEMNYSDTKHVALYRPMMIKVQEVNSNAFFSMHPYTAATRSPVLSRRFIIQFGEADNMFANMYTKLSAKIDNMVDSDDDDQFEEFDEGDIEMPQAAIEVKNKPTVH